MARRLIAVLALAALPLNAENVLVKLNGEARPVTMDLETYVAAALAGEAGGFESIEALRAMAVTARTYARVNRGRHRGDGYDFCETTHCQNVQMRSLTARLRRAAEDTEGIVLWAASRPALIFYTEHCGGHTEAAGTLWPASARAHLRGVEDSFCLSAGRQTWRSRLRLDDIARALGLARLDTLEIARRSATGRVHRLRIDRALVSGENFHLAIGRELGWEHVHSKLYEIHHDGPDIVFEGWGRGHGVGLCQTGADQRGKAGESWRQILAAYFPGTRAGVTPRDVEWRAMHAERVDVEGSGAPGEEQVPALATRALAQAERLTGRAVRLRPLIRVYPTVAVFRDATGEPGFVAASTRGRIIRLQPPARLLAENRLEQTLLHEMLHLALAPPPGATLPRWFEEGLVLWLEQPLAKPARLDPRTERRLLRPSSESDLRLAYANARAAVAWLISEYSREAVLGWAATGLPANLAGFG